jgi:hypothetical protein
VPPLKPKPIANAKVDGGGQPMFIIIVNLAEDVPDAA